MCFMLMIIWNSQNSFSFQNGAIDNTFWRAQRFDHREGRYENTQAPKWAVDLHPDQRKDRLLRLTEIGLQDSAHRTRDPAHFSKPAQNSDRLVTRWWLFEIPSGQTFFETQWSVKVRWISKNQTLCQIEAWALSRLEPLPLARRPSFFRSTAHL